jgi:hypothetical protein
MVGAVSSYAIIWSPEWLSLLQLSGVMVFPAIAALHVLHREREDYGWPGTLASLASFLGLALIFVSWPLETMLGLGVAVLTLGVGLVLATVGLLLLGLIINTERVLPWWCGAALILGSPLGVPLGMVFVWPLGLDEMAIILPLGLG